MDEAKPLTKEEREQIAGWLNGDYSHVPRTLLRKAMLSEAFYHRKAEAKSEMLDIAMAGNPYDLGDEAKRRRLRRRCE